MMHTTVISDKLHLVPVTLHLAAAGKLFEPWDPFPVQSLSDKHTVGSSKKKTKVSPSQ